MLISFLAEARQHKYHCDKLILFALVLTSALCLFVSGAAAAQVTLAWDANQPAPTGYRAFQRVAGAAYNYAQPAWPTDGGNHTETTCTLTNLTAGTTYYFVVRAYVGNDQSGDSNEISYTVPAGTTLSSITIDGPAQINDNTSAQYTCTANYSDGSTAVVSSGVAWSENSSATTINASGLLTASDVASDTTVTLSASYNGLSDTHAVTVKNNAATLSSITIDGPDQINDNTSTQYTCTATYSDGSTAAVSSGVAWSENSSATTINASGLLTASDVTSDTTVTLSASYNGVSDTHAVTVMNNAATLSSITIDGPAQVNENSSAQYTCTANYKDGSTADVSSGVVWSASSSATTVNASGLLTASDVASDTLVILSASYNGVSDVHAVTVKNDGPALSSITISGPAQVNENSSVQYTCTAYYSDNSHSIVTGSVNWSVNSAIGSISTGGYLTLGPAENDQTLTITAALDGKHANFNLTVSNTGNTHALTIDISGAGSVVLDPPGETFDEGTVVTLTAQANQAWAFDGWIGSVSDPDATVTTVVMNSDISLSVTFLEDADLDSVPDKEEWGIDSLDNTFDGNADGIADYLQGNVVSMHTSDYLHFVTLSVPEPGIITTCKIKDSASMANAPTVCTLPLGLISIRIENITPGASVPLTIFLPSGSEFNTYYKYGAALYSPAAHWYEFMYDQSSGTGAVFNGDTVTLYLKDGKRGDDDLLENGVISDPGGPGMIQASTTPTPNGTQLSDDYSTGAGSSGSAGCFINSIAHLF